MNLKRIGIVAGVSVLSLMLGLLIRRSLRVPEQPIIEQPSDVSSLEQMSRLAEFQRRSDFLAERAAAVAGFLEYRPDVGASGVRWKGGDSVLTTGHDRALRIVVGRATELAKATHAELGMASDSMPNDLLIVGRSSDGRILSTLASSLGPTATASCDGVEVPRLVLDVALDDALAGAVVFDLEARAVGMILRCGRTLNAVTASGINRLLAGAGTINGRLRDDYGFTSAALDSAARKYFRLDSGLLITEVNQSSGVAPVLSPGDVLIAVDGRPVNGVDDLAPLVAAGDLATHIAVRRRGSAVATVRLPRRSRPNPDPRAGRGAALGLELSASRGVSIERVRQGSVAHVAGLGPGDYLVRIGGRLLLSEAAAVRELDAVSGRTTFIVFERAGIQHGVLVSP